MVSVNVSEQKWCCGDIRAEVQDSQSIPWVVSLVFAPTVPFVRRRCALLPWSACLTFHLFIHFFFFFHFLFHAVAFFVYSSFILWTKEIGDTYIVVALGRIERIKAKRREENHLSTTITYRSSAQYIPLVIFFLVSFFSFLVCVGYRLPFLGALLANTVFSNREPTTYSRNTHEHTKEKWKLFYSSA